MLRREDGDRAIRLTLARPDRGNALTGELLDALADAVADAEGPIVVAGAGDVFCTGGDLADLAAASRDPDAARRFVERLVGALDVVERHDAPVVASVDGAALGGGFELVAAADVAVASERASFGLPETTVGLTTPLTSERVTAIAGKKRMMRLSLTDETVDAGTAERWGLVNHAVPSDEVADSVDAYLERFAAADPAALATTKERVLGTVRPDGWRDRAVETMVERLTAVETRDRLERAAEG